MGGAVTEWIHTVLFSSVFLTIILHIFIALKLRWSAIKFYQLWYIRP